ncbi:MAG: efflux RND transporter periplasmic adaptor subunit [Sphingomonadales bacterium]|nr:efflux RND transporter periplasmic adaptor subunit [Sphingomonadales bacterium]
MIEMKKKWVLPAIALIMLGFVMAIFGGVFKEKISPSILDQVKVDGGAETFAVTTHEQVVFETLPGTLRARVATIVSSRLLAGIKAVHVRAGDRVEAGDLLAELDNEDLKARLTSWQQQVRSFEVKLDQARPHFERIEQLYNEGVSSKAQLDQATANYQGAIAELAGANASAQEAQTALNFSQIKAPISGRIIDRLAEPGSMASPGMALVSIYNPTTLRVEVNVRESLALNLAIGDELQAEVPSINKAFTSIVEEIIPEAHTGSRSFLVKASIITDAQLVPGLFVRLHIPMGTEQQIYIPQSYVREMGQLNIVWVLINGTAHKQVVSLGGVNLDGNRQLIKGLKAGDILLHPDTLSH